ncbi:tRNA 2-selenouridine(34) synthase MnmH [Halosquirtibacter xylanolyticus]|uniref:tRNA 2-selenouridine(34) synthase MnmH n=1 Tax=Halosquirtibacter xylanolyticus TaxID=3374599 RepID=UPI0037484C61|nr:tRNA 2-selenouridine(34) synthase MnmH [Prolixibacteraceae bacterium]
MELISAEEFLVKSEKYPIIDVRSPGEFEEGHIPNAVNMSLFDNDERAKVGTIYKRQGKDTAVLKGLEFVGPKMSVWAKRAKKMAVDNTILIHCWRGGMRSQSMAWLFEKVGIKCYVLTGGYKAYRSHLLEHVDQLPKLIVLEGFSGSGKTDILHHLEKSGSQIIDLEALASHRGSAFGGIGQKSQPSTQQFQNDLYQKVRLLDPSKPVWVEGESKFIGRVFLPDPFWERMNHCALLVIEMTREYRVKQLVKDYSRLDTDKMKGAINNLVKRLGHQRKDHILSCYESGDFDVVADLLLEYYDKTYEYSRDQMKDKKHVFTKVLPNTSSDDHARILIEEIETNYDQIYGVC